MALSKKAALWTAGILIAPLTIGGVAFGTTLADKRDSATVLRVIDGDTLDVDLEGEAVRVCLLNIDTPETKHPQEAVQCLGPEAAKFLEDLLPVGASVELKYDVERKDNYGRTLAGVYHNDALVNAQIAAQGLGLSVIYEPNDRFYDEVKAAENQARNESSGLFDSDIECALPWQIDNLQAQVSQLSTLQPQDVQAVDAELEDLALLMETADEYMALIKTLDGPLANHGELILLYRVHNWRLDKFTTQLDGVVATLEKRKDELEDLRDEIKAEEERRRAEEKRKKEEQERKEKEERERQEAEAAELQRQQAAQEEQRRQAEAEAARQQTRTPKNSGSSGGTAPAPTPSRNSNSNPNNAPSGYGTDADYPGYTGPRCYAPGGRSGNRAELRGC